MEAARTAAINQEIKRIVTEVLLKVGAARVLMVILDNFFYDIYVFVCVYSFFGF